MPTARMTRLPFVCIPKNTTPSGKHYRHASIRSSVKDVAVGRGIGRLNFELSSYLNSQNKEQPMYLLDFHATVVLVTGYGAVKRSAVLGRWVAVEGRITLAQLKIALSGSGV